MVSAVRLRSIFGWGLIAVILALFFMPVELTQDTAALRQPQTPVSNERPLPRPATLTALPRGVSNPADAETADVSPTEPADAALAALTQAPGQASPTVNTGTGGLALPASDPAPELQKPASPQPLADINNLPDDAVAALSDAPKRVQLGQISQSPVLATPEPELNPFSDDPLQSRATTANVAAGIANAAAPAPLANKPVDSEVDLLLTDGASQIDVGEQPGAPSPARLTSEFASLAPTAADPLVGAARSSSNLAQLAAETPSPVQFDTAPSGPAIAKPVAPDALGADITAEKLAFLVAPSEQQPATLEPAPQQPVDLVPDAIPAVAKLTGAPQTAAAQLRYVSGRVVNLRASPELSDNVIGQLRLGAQVETFEQQGKWSRITATQAGQKVSGWMSRRYLAAQRPAAAMQMASPRRAPKIARAATKPRSRSVATQADIRRAETRIIRQSIARRSGGCVCPHSLNSAGQRCGNQSQWSMPNGLSPICYPTDISRASMKRYLARQGKILR